MAAERHGAVVALAGVSTAAALTLARVFRDGSFVLPVLGAVALSFALGWLGRTQQWSPVTNEIVAAAGLVLYLAWVIEPSRTTYGLPTAGTLDALTRDLGHGLEQLRTAVPPTAVTKGLLLLAIGGLYLCSHLADWAATRLDAIVQAIIPPFVFFIVTSALGTSHLRVVTTAGFLATALIFVLVQSAAVQSSATAWATSVRRARGPALLIASGVPIVVIVLVAALAIGPTVPGANATALARLKGVGARADQSRQTISPLVDLKPRLTHNPVIELFTVASLEPHNWRITALDEFDGRTWTSVGSYTSAKGTLFRERDDHSPTVRVHQEYAISGLDTFWLPAAYRPSHITLKGARIHNPSMTLLTDHATAAGLHYSVDSAVPSPTRAQLENAPLVAGFERYTRLPPDFPDRVRALAQQVTRNARTPYEQARMLQDFLRSNYHYNENVRPGHSNSALLTFLFQTRQGYCEQFAGAFAAMARTLGLPTRVAVGFTPGRFDGSVYRVETNNAHAWPEVHFGGYGWVAFEPTPSRFELTASNYTGTFQPQVSTATTVTTAAVSTTAPSNATPPTTRPFKDDASQNGGRGRHRRSGLMTGLLIVLALLAGIVLGGGVYAGAVLGTKARRRQRRARGVPSARIAGAWAEAIDRLEEARFTLPASATPSELAQTASRERPKVGPPMSDLAGLQTQATYSKAAPATEDADDAWAAVDSVVQALDEGEPFRARWRRRLDPGWSRRRASSERDLVDSDRR